MHTVHLANEFFLKIVSNKNSIMIVVSGVILWPQSAVWCFTKGSLSPGKFPGVYKPYLACRLVSASHNCSAAMRPGRRHTNQPLLGQKQSKAVCTGIQRLDTGEGKGLKSSSFGLFENRSLNEVPSLVDFHHKPQSDLHHAPQPLPGVEISAK